MLAHPSPPISASVTGDYGKNLPRLTLPRRILRGRARGALNARAAGRQARGCVGSAGDAARRHRPALRRAAAETEQCLEERDSARRRDAGPPLTRRCNLLLALALLQRLDHAAPALDRPDRAAADVATV